VRCEIAKRNDGAPGIDGVTFEAVEAQGVEALLERLRDELIGRTYQPLPARTEGRGKVRVLSIPRFARSCATHQYVPDQLAAELILPMASRGAALAYGA
jgi:hypothetical protein